MKYKFSIFTLSIVFLFCTCKKDDKVYILQNETGERIHFDLYGSKVDFSNASNIIASGVIEKDKTLEIPAAKIHDVLACIIDWYNDDLLISSWLGDGNGLYVEPGISHIVKQPSCNLRKTFFNNRQLVRWKTIDVLDAAGRHFQNLNLRDSTIGMIVGKTAVTLFGINTSGNATIRSIEIYNDMNGDICASPFYIFIGGSFPVHRDMHKQASDTVILKTSDLHFLMVKE